MAAYIGIFRKQKSKAIGNLEKKDKKEYFTLRISYCSSVNKPEDKSCKTCKGNVMDCAV